MGSPSDQKTADGGLPTYAPLPTEPEYDSTLVDPQVERRRRRRRVVLRHGVFFIFCALVFSIIHRRNKFEGMLAYYEHSDDDLFFAERVPFVQQPDHPHPHPYPAECVKWSNETAIEESTFTYSFPIDSPALHFLSRGPLIGSVEYVLSDEDSDEIKVSLSLNGTRSLIATGEHPENDHKPASKWSKLCPSWVSSLKNKLTSKHRKPRAKVCLLKDHGSQELAGFAVVTRHHPRRSGEPWHLPPAPLTHPTPPTPPDHPHHPSPPGPPAPPHRGGKFPPPPPGPPPPFPPHDGEYPPPPPPPFPPHHPHEPHHPPPPPGGEGFDNSELPAHPHKRDHKNKNKLEKPKMFGLKYDVPLVHAKVVVTIPRGKQSVASFRSIFPGMKQKVGNVFDDVEFEYLTLVGTRVTVDTVTAGQALIVTNSEHAINGSYTVYDKLSIVARNAPITADVTAYSSPDARRPTKVEIVTHNATIDASLALLLNTTIEEVEHYNGSFVISAVTSEATIATTITAQPIDSHLEYSAVSKGDSIKATFAPEYEGSFSLVSSRNGGAVIESDKETPDPKGLGRTREVRTRAIFGPIVSGSVAWKGDAVDDEEMAEWEAFVDDVEAEIEGGEEEVEDEGLVGGWEVVEQLASDDAAVEMMPVEALMHFVQAEQARAPGSSISLVTSGATNYLYFA